MKLSFFKTVFTFVILFGSANIAFAQTEREAGIEFYRKADYKNAVKMLKKAAKKNPADYQIFYYLGLTYLQSNEPKNASDALEKAVGLNKTGAEIYAALAYSYMFRKDLNNADRNAQNALKINPKVADAHYILGATSLRRGSFNVAYERANKAIELNPNLADAYFLKTEALINSFAAQSRSVVKPAENKYDLLKEAAESLSKYLSFLPNGKDSEYFREYLNSLNFFAQYYSLPENRKPINFDAPPPSQDDPNSLKITSKPKPSYTTQARQANVTGNVRVLVAFGASGKIDHVLVTESLGYGLDEQAVKAARKIKFEPATKDGKPLSVVKVVVFNYLIY